MPVAFTVAIPTYNGESRLPDVLDRLRSQVCTEGFSWEILVVDNNSTDNTAKVVQAYQADWPKSHPLRYLFEVRQGAAFARERAFEEAKGDLIGFLDDDNVPTSDWVAAAYAFGQAHPKAGAYGSNVHAAYEITPPENFHRLAPFLAIVERGSVPFQYQRRHKVLPPAAGLVVRKQAWKESSPSRLILTGRVSGNMLTGEDLEMLCYIQNAGWEIWYNPTMQIVHKIPHWRLHRNYLIPFMQGVGLGRHVTRMLSVSPWQRPIAFLAYMLNDLRKICVHLLKYGSKVKTDLIAECEMQLFLSSLSSPFYLWRHGYLKFNNKSVNDANFFIVSNVRSDLQYSDPPRS